MADMPPELLVKAPGELRKEVLALRVALEQATAEAGQATAQAQQAGEALADAQRLAAEQATAQEERFDDMCQFMEGLLKNLKSENVRLHEQLHAQSDERRREVHAQLRHDAPLDETDETDETDEFLAAEAAAAEGEGADAPAASSPLREARLHTQLRSHALIEEAHELSTAEAEARDMPEVSSPLREARLRRIIIWDDEDEDAEETVEGGQ